MPLEKLDWGHGPNKPVRMWTADQIRKVMDEHHPVQEGDCLCAWWVHSSNPHQEFTTDHLIEELEKL